MSRGLISLSFCGGVMVGRGRVGKEILQDASKAIVLGNIAESWLALDVFFVERNGKGSVQEHWIDNNWS